MTQRPPAELSVGFEPIDVQHAVLLRRVEAAAAAAREGRLAETRAELASLADELAAHFAAEERLMADAGYPDRGKHKNAHDLFMHDFARIAGELETFGLTPPLCDAIEARMPEWFRFHVQVNDVPLGRFLAARGARPGARAQGANRQAE